ncbi:MAG: response regulator [Desulfobacteraceae bacterium]|nr:MAG: response regulator [Desulfobacteraceae bacterium]
MKGSRILLVDDEEIFTRNMAKLLSTRGYIVTAVNSGDAAIRALEEHPVDVIVLDLKMPGMDGLTTLKEIQKLGLFAQTLILTGHGSIDSALEAMKFGAYDYLTKPCEIDDLVAKIEGAWEKKDKALKTDLQEKIQRVVESPKSVFDVFPSKKR